MYPIWDMDKEPLSIANLEHAKNILDKSNMKYMTIENVTTDDLQMLITILYVYSSIGKDIQEIKEYIKKLKEA